MFIHASEGMKREKMRRELLKKETPCRFYIKPLDDALGGLMRSELVVIGADSGIGKTEFANQLACKNASQGKKVALISLEGDKDEVWRRLKFNHISQNYYRNRLWLNGHSMDMSYPNYVLSKIEDPIINDLENQAEAYINEKLGNRLSVFEKENMNDIDGIMKSLEMNIKSVYIQEPCETNPFGIKEYRSEFDLVVIDHLHYFDNVSGDNENVHTTRIMREIKRYTEELSTPVVLVSHLRKKTRDRGIPDIEDLHGTSNIAKISSTTILLTPYYSKYDYHAMIYPTFIRYAKSRAGIPQTLCALVDFDNKIKEYSEPYDLYWVNSEGEPEAILDDNYPSWARKKKDGPKRNIYGD